MLRLVPESGPEILLDRPRLLVGRDAACDVVLKHPSVSRRHAVIEGTPAGFVIEDQRSANGIRIDGQPVSKAPLEAGRALQIGSLAFRIEEVPPPEAEPPAEASAAPPSPVRPVLAAPSGASGMSTEAAAARLGLAVEASPQDVAERYRRLAADLEARLAHAPTPALKRMYQKDLQDLRAACEALAPGALRPS
jgi:pSer/pThr/pTyr-binding forkhead associated (FHA) protein